MKETTSESIQKILDARGQSASQIGHLTEDWKKRQKKIGQFESTVKELMAVCTKAMPTASSDELQSYQELLEYLNELNNQQIFQNAVRECDYALRKLAQLSDRFNRPTLNIAVAGVGRCGKSTTLKSIIGQEHDDNRVIPSGKGTAVTAGKSSIQCVSSEDDEKTVVYYHTPESFLSEVINPLLQDLMLGSKVCSTLDDFGQLNYEELRSLFETKRLEALQKVRDAEKNSTREELEIAKAFASSFNLKTERLSHLEDMLNAYPAYRNRLTGTSETVPIDQTSRYVSYPKNGGATICYSVKECVIYSRFPNNTVKALQLIDLPGLGTGSLSERRCFMEGFNHTVDLVLMVRRPEGNYQNFTTDDDLRVIEVIEATFGSEHLHECMLLFQNDANLPQSNVEEALSKISKWNSLRTQPVTVIRGDAQDISDVQNRILPELLQFMLKQLPALDSALIKENMPELESQAAKLDEQLDEVEHKLNSMKRNFRSGDANANNICDKSNSLRYEIINGLNDIMDYYANDFEQESSLLPDKIVELSERLREWARTTFNPKEESKLLRVKNEIRRAQSAVPYANTQLHSLRIHVTETYAEMEKIHNDLIREMQEKVAALLSYCFPTLLKNRKTLAEQVEFFTASGDCPEIVDALTTVLSLEIPFYNTVYPDLRAEVFESVDLLERNFQMDASLPEEKKAAIVLSELQNTAFSWLFKAEGVLQAQSRIKEILLASLERLQDRLGRSDSTNRELTDLVEHYWSEIQMDGNAYSQDIRNKLSKIGK